MTPALRPSPRRDARCIPRRQREDDRHAAAARPGNHAHLVSHQPHHPQAMPGQVRPRTRQIPADRPRSLPGSGGRGYAIVFDPAAQPPGHDPHPQPPRSGTMHDHVRRQLMNRDHHIISASRGHPCPGRISPRRCPQRRQHARIERVIQDRRHPAAHPAGRVIARPGRTARRSVSGHGGDQADMRLACRADPAGPSPGQRTAPQGPREPAPGCQQHHRAQART